MGHFSYTCRLSGIPITEGDKAVLIPLLPNGSYYDNSEESIRKFGKTNYCSNDGQNVFFKPWAFPIFGEYDSYGRLENIESDDNTKFLEAYFKLSIQEIADVICCGRKNDGYDDCLDVVKIGTKKSKGDDYGKPKYKSEYEIIIKSSGTWMRREIYDSLSKLIRSDWHNDLDLGIPAILKAIGFKESGKSKDERYNRIFVQGPVSLKTDGNWISVTENSSIYNFDNLKKYCKNKGLDIDISEISKKSYYQQVYDYIIPEIKKIDHSSRWEGDRVRSLFLTEKYDVPKISEAYFNAVKKEGNNFLRNNICDWHTVSNFFYYMGHYLSPVGTAPQDGDPESVLKVITIAKEILEEQVAKYNARNDEDEDEDSE